MMRDKINGLVHMLENDPKEKKIIQRHKLIAKIIVYFITCCIVASFLFMVSVPFVSGLLDEMFPLKDGATRRIWAMHPDYYFFDAEKHFYLVSIHSAIIGFGIASIHIGLDTKFGVIIELMLAVLSVVW